MKEFIRVLGIDDGPFKFTDERVPIVGILMRGTYIDGVMTSDVQVDGKDATGTVIEMVNGSRYKEQVRVIMVDGIALGGFNVVDLEEVNERTGIPIMSVTRDKPDFEAMKDVLRSKFDDWERRWGIVSKGTLQVSKGTLQVIDTEHKPLHIKVIGMDEADTCEIVTRSIVRGALPEPIRVAHLVATAIVKGESKGNA
jgi:endonuclease V-like protein UPF0215 family